MAYGDTWTQSATGPTDSWPFAAVNSDGSKIYAYGPSDKIYLSVDQGATFTETLTQPGDNTRKLQCISSNGLIVYVTASDGLGSIKLYKSADGGDTWSDITESGYDYSGYGNVSCSTDGQTIYTCAYDGAVNDVLKSINAGTSWTILTSPTPEPSDIWCSGDGQIVVSNGYDDPNYATHLSLNGGTSWVTIADLGTQAVCFAALSNDGSTIYAVADDGVYVSTDSGSNFDITTVVTTGVVSGRRCGCSSDGKYAVALYNSPPDPIYLYVTEDFGSTWVLADAADGWWAPAMSGDGTTIVAGLASNGIYYSLNSFFSITSITPSTGSTAGGTPVTIEGIGFDPAATAAIDGNDLTDVTVVDSTTITGITPAGTAGVVDVTVTNP